MSNEKDTNKSSISKGMLVLVIALAVVATTLLFVTMMTLTGSWSDSFYIAGAVLVFLSVIWAIVDVVRKKKS